MTDENHWRVIRLTEFTRPSAPATTLLQQWYHHIRNIFIQADEASLEEESESLPGYRDFSVAPAAQALDEAFADWLSKPTPGVKFLVGPPHSGLASIASVWAAQRDWSCLTAPDRKQIEEAAIDSWWEPQAAEQWVIPDLSSYWQRRVNGLSFIRALLPRILQGSLGQGLVVCDSWSFIFLQHTSLLHLSHIYCFAAADAPLLRQLGIRAPTKQLKSLAAQALGNPGVALTLWTAMWEGHHEPPCVPIGSDDSTAFVLYSLLLHHGLSRDDLQDVLPNLTVTQIDGQLLLLEQAQIVHREQQQWQVSVHGYLTARDFLKSRGFDVDAF